MSICWYIYYEQSWLVLKYLSSCDGCDAHSYMFDQFYLYYVMNLWLWAVLHFNVSLIILFLLCSVALLMQQMTDFLRQNKWNYCLDCPFVRSSIAWDSISDFQTAFFNGMHYYYLLSLLFCISLCTSLWILPIIWSYR